MIVVCGVVGKKYKNIWIPFPLIVFFVVMLVVHMYAAFNSDNNFDMFITYMWNTMMELVLSSASLISFLIVDMKAESNF